MRWDFYDHKSGVYRGENVSDPGRGQHATKLIGWGFSEENDDPYWIRMNSGRNWGTAGAGFVEIRGRCFVRESRVRPRVFPDFGNHENAPRDLHQRVFRARGGGEVPSFGCERK